MIPTLLVLGLLAGRWWAVPLGACAWALLLGLDGICDLRCSPGALALALTAANLAVGVVAHKGVMRAVRPRALLG